jgi:hypothetical protein
MIAGRVTIAASFVVEVVEKGSGRVNKRREEDAGRIVILPTVLQGSEDATVELISSKYNISLISNEPAWVTDVVAPSWEELDIELANIAHEVMDLESRLKLVEAWRSAVREPLRLLYSHDKELEAAVVAVFRELGAKMTVPEENNRTDGFIEYELDGQRRHAVLEVKSKGKRQFDEQSQHQLDEWQSETIDEMMWYLRR